MTEQAALLRFIWAQPGAQPPSGLRPLPGVGLDEGLRLYRENAKAVSVRALAAAYPRVVAWLGEADFAGLAWALARAHPPTEGDAAAWGAALADFLRAQPGMDPALPALAELDWALHRLAVQADDPPAQPQCWQLLQTMPPERVRLRLSGGVRLLHLPDLLAEAAWEAALAGEPSSLARSAWLMLWRDGWRPCWQPISAAEAHWWESLLAGQSLGDALGALTEAGHDLDLGAWLAQAWAQGTWRGAEAV